MTTTKHLNTYFKVQGSKSNNEYIYTKKKYPRNFTREDKRIANSRYSRRQALITRKEILLMVCSLLLFLMFAKIGNENNSYTTAFFTSLVMFLVMIPFFYTMKKVYYVILIYAIILVLLGCLGYGWGIIGVIVNLNPLKTKKVTEIIEN